MRIYFMSICGTGMGNAALLMKSLGHEVLGSDQNVYPPMSDRLEASGIEILSGFSAERLKRMRPDYVVVGNVNTRGNEEIEWLLESRSITMLSMPELLSRFLLRDRWNIVVAGTHGKTTTTAMTAYLLQANEPQSGHLIGGVCRDFEGNAQAGEVGFPFVIEGDEYDSAFFDKRSKFIHYQPNILVINNLEFDHADIFRDLEDIKRSFRHLIKLVPRSGALLVNSDDADAMGIARGATWTRVIPVGINDLAEVAIKDVRSDSDGTRFSLFWGGNLWRQMKIQQWGLFNVRNAAMASVAAGMALLPNRPTDFDPSVLSGFKGVVRRQELLFETEKVSVFNDFAHHPTAVKGTLESMRERFVGRRLIAVFEARSNTACRNIHQASFTDAFRVADEVIFGEVYRSDRYKDSERIDFSKMAEKIGGQAIVAPSNGSIPKLLVERIKANKDSAVVVFFSNGSFDGVPQMVVEMLQ